MNSNKVINAFLVLSGLIGLIVGVGLVFFPVAMEAEYDIVISNISQLSETRAPGVSLLSISIIILIGAFSHRWKYIALVLTTVVFLSYGIGRVLSIIFDGMPAQGLITAMVVELAIGLGGALVLWKVVRLKKAI